jgi:hypothetical protein
MLFADNVALGDTRRVRQGGVPVVEGGCGAVGVSGGVRQRPRDRGRRGGF